MEVDYVTVDFNGILPRSPKRTPLSISRTNLRYWPSPLCDDDSVAFFFDVVQQPQALGLELGYWNGDFFHTSILDLTTQNGQINPFSKHHLQVVFICGSIDSGAV